LPRLIRGFDSPHLLQVNI